MDWQNDHEYLGTEFDWLACDQDGNVAYFSTAGFGPLPEAVLRDVDGTADAIDEVLASPPLSAFRVRQPDRFNIDDWLNMAARGFYAFDWRRESKRYELVAEPEFPVNLDELPGSVATISRQCRFEGSFDKLRRIQAGPASG